MDDLQKAIETVQGKELANKYKQARFAGAEGPEFKTFENFCKWAFANGYKPGTVLHRGKGEKVHRASTSYFQAHEEKNIESMRKHNGGELDRSIERYNETVNGIRRAVGWDPLPAGEDGVDDY